VARSIKRPCSVLRQMYAKREIASCIYMRVSELRVSEIIEFQSWLSQSNSWKDSIELGFELYNKNVFIFFLLYKWRYRAAKSESGNLHLRNVTVLCTVTIFVLLQYAALTNNFSASATEENWQYLQRLYDNVFMIYACIERERAREWKSEWDSFFSWLSMMSIFATNLTADDSSFHSDMNVYASCK